MFDLTQIRKLTVALLGCWTSLGTTSPAWYNESAITTTPLTPNQIMSNVVERLEWKKGQRLESHFEYQKLRIKEEFDINDSRREKEELLYRVYPIHGRSYSRLIERDGVALQGRHLKNEQKKEARIKAERERGNYELVAEEEERSIDHAVIERLEFELAGIERLNQHDTYALGFKSRTSNKKSKSIKERFLSNLQGMIWVERNSYEVARLQFELTSEVKVWGGLLASIKNLKFKFEQAEIQKDCWFPTVFEFEMSGRRLVSTMGFRSRVVSFDFTRTASEESPTSDANLSSSESHAIPEDRAILGREQ